MWFRTATASRSDSIASRRLRAGVLTALLLTLTSRAGAGPTLDDLRGHVAVGYGWLTIAHAPAGSLSFAGGLELPLAGAWRAGVDVGYSLLGTRILEEGTQGGELDYSVFEALALAHWTPRRGPVGHVSFGPGVFHARADLTSSAPAAFADRAVEETAMGVALSATLIPRGPSPVRAGLELGSRTILLSEEAWTLFTGRLTIHY